LTRWLRLINTRKAEIQENIKSAIAAAVVERGKETGCYKKPASLGLRAELNRLRP